MLDKFIDYSLKNKLAVFLFTLGLVGYGIYALMNISIGAVPDITNNQVQVITTSRNLSTEDVEKFLTAPVELEMANLPGVNEIRSVSKFGLSVVTVVFDDAIGTYLPRQLIAEKIKNAAEKIPVGFGTPSMGPISTGLGEIYQYILDVKPEYQDQYSVTDLRTIQDWIVKRQLSGIPGVVEVNTWGGYLKTYEVAVDPLRLKSMDITISDVYRAMKENNSVAGGGYIEKANEAYFIRAEGLVASLKDIENIIVSNRSGIPIFIKDVAEVGIGHATRFGAITGNGEGEKVLGQIMMLKGASSKAVIDEVKDRVAQIQGSLPEGVFINPFLERSELIGRTTFTIAENLILGCLIVVFVVIVLLGNIRSGLVVASVIPLCLLFAISLMYIFGIDANLMSLGAIDFGIIIDGAVIIVEYVTFKISQQSSQLALVSGDNKGSLLDKITYNGTSKMMHSAIFGQLIIIIVFIPILSLSGVEGKMFKPMAMTFCFALIGAMILCFTYVPAMSALFIKPPKNDQKNISQRIMDKLQSGYRNILVYALKIKYVILIIAIGLLIVSGFLFNKMGGEFVPTLDEGDFVIQPTLKTGMSLSASVNMTTRMEQIIKRFPEVNQVVSRIGAAEVPTDPMSMEQSDIIVTLIPKNDWTSASSKDALIEIIKKTIEDEIPAIEMEFTQPIEMRFNELISGVRADLAIKIYGDDLDVLYDKAIEIKHALEGIEGAADITVDKTAGLPQMMINYDRNMLAKYGVNISDLNEIISMGFAGVTAGTIFEGERQFDLVIRYDSNNRQDLDNIKNAMVDLPNGSQIPMSAFADITHTTGPAQISRDDTKRRIVIGVNVRGRDLQSVVEDVRATIKDEVDIPVGYLVEYGGQFENLQSASKRLLVAVPISLILIFILLYFAFKSLSQALLIYSAIPLSAVGGIVLLHLRDMPFSISAGVGFIALFGIAVLNGIVLMEHFKDLKEEGLDDIQQRVIQGATERLRPVLLTATAAALGFLPMAISTSAGAEVQQPLATVVIGGLITATLLTLVVLPILYTIFEKSSKPHLKMDGKLLSLLVLIIIPALGFSQRVVTLDEAIEIAYQNNLGLKSSMLKIDRDKALVGAAKKMDKTRFSYNFNEDNAVEIGGPLHVFGAKQSFKMKAFQNAKKRVAESQVSLQESMVAISKQYLAKEVSSAYNSIVYWRSLENEYSYLDSLYRVFEKATLRKHELGEENNLEKITSTVKRSNIQLKLKQTQQQLLEANLLLNNWIQGEEMVMISEQEFRKMPVFSIDIDEHSLLEYQDRNIDMSVANQTLSQKNKLPEFDISLQNGINSFSDFKLFPGIQAGIAIPLWRKSYDSLEEAAAIDVTIKQAEYGNQRRLIENTQAKWNAEMKRHLHAIDQYEISGRMLRADLIDFAQKSYIGGEIDIFQYIISLENATNMHIQYLESLLRYNKSVIEMNYLLN